MRKSIIFGIVVLLIFLSIPKLLDAQYVPECKYQLNKSNLVIDYDTINYIPRFVYYKLEGAKLKYQDNARGEFAVDESVSKSADPYDYIFSGYDRGHLCPVASCTSYDQLKDCMLMTNIVPQLPELNRGLWKRIENFERRNAEPYCYVICGTILDRNPKKLNDKISIPSKFYKIIYNPRLGMAAFLVNQTDNDDISVYCVTVDQLEELTGIDFFSRLSWVTQKKLESALPNDDWNW